MEQTVKSLSEDIESLDSLITKGENQLLNGRLSQGLSTFEKVEKKLENRHPNFYFRMGLALFEFGSEEGREKALLLASKKFKMATSLLPQSVEIYQAWGNTLALLGQRLEEHHFFLSAKEKYEKALAFGGESTDLYWDYAVVWYHLAVHSGEAYDYQMALRYFDQAAKEYRNMPTDFWIDYGTTAFALSEILQDPKQVIRAVNCFKHATVLDESSFDGFCSLAEALCALYEHSHDDDHFTQANETFGAAVKLCPQEASTWLSWAQLLLKSARRSGDLQRLRLSLEKCHHAYACDDENPLILATWAESLALLGQLTERLDLIYEAENKIAEALEFEEQDPALWLCLGMCMNSFAAYFQDCEHYYLAIEKFQTGLSFDRTYHPLWHEMANSYFAVGAMENDPDLLVGALKFYDKALYFKETSERHIDSAKALSKLGELTQHQGWFEQSLYHFEMAFSMQKHAIYLHPEWLFHYALTLDMLGDFHDEEKYYTKAIEIFSHVIMVDPDFPKIHHHLAQAYSHLGELSHENESFHRSIHHLRLALKREEDNDAVYLDWGIALINLAEHSPVFTDVEQLFSDAQAKLTKSAKLGNPSAYYHLSCLYSLTNKYDEALFFLQKAQTWDALPPIEELLADDWLENLRGTAQFRDFLAEHHLSE